MGNTRRDFCNEMNNVYKNHDVYIGRSFEARKMGT